MEALGKVIPQRKQGEDVLTYARRLKKEGFIPSEDMDAELYKIAWNQQYEERKAQDEELKINHACLTCEGVGSIKDAQGDWIQCLICEGSGMETAQEANLAPKELVFLNYLRDKGVFKSKLTAEIIHRVFAYCQDKEIAAEDVEKMEEQFNWLVRASKRKLLKGEKEPLEIVTGYFVTCGAFPAWRYKELENIAKANRSVKASVVPF